MTVHKFVIKKVYHHYKSDDFELHADFMNELFFDSLEFYVLIGEVEKEFGVLIPDTDAELLTTPQKLIDYVDARI